MRPLIIHMHQLIFGRFEPLDARARSWVVGFMFCDVALRCAALRRATTFVTENSLCADLILVQRHQH